MARLARQWLLAVVSFPHRVFRGESVARRAVGSANLQLSALSSFHSRQTHMTLATSSRRGRSAGPGRDDHAT